MYRGRFAPSPTGLLHFGSLVTALASWLRARSCGGRWLVRIEDVDRTREVPKAAIQIQRSLRSFGLESDEPVVYQSQRLALYDAALAHLKTVGLAYPCWCSRSQLEPVQGIHPAECVSTPTARDPAWRVRVAGNVSFHDALQGTFTQDLAREVGDFVLLRADGVYSYQLAVVVDDAAQGVNEIVRGADLIDSTPRQILLQRLLGYTLPAYVHLPLVLGTNGRKLSKHESALPVDVRDPLPVLRAALDFLGQPKTTAVNLSALLQQAVEHFQLSEVAPAPPPIGPIAAAQKDVC